VYLLVADGAEMREPVHVVHLSTGTRAAHPRLVVDVGTGGQLHLVETHVSLPGAGFTNASTTIRLAGHAHVAVHRVQDEHPDNVHLGRLHLQQRTSSHSEITVLSRGAATSRLSTFIELLEPGAECQVTGLLTPRPGARHDDLVTVDHTASHCTSDLRVRAVVPEAARTSASGHVIVRPDTTGTAVHQRTDNLLLDTSAQADSRPWLEIFTDDLRATHGSATGRLDDDALFYLRSRGIPLAQARDVLVGAFARTIVERLEPPSLREKVVAWFGWEDDA
jgi:Fe-S cluster assembly protein SufD